MKIFEAPDGSRWKIEITNPGSSNAMVRFRHPDPRSSRLDRYAWFISRGPESRSVTSRLSPQKVLEGLSDSELSRLYRRSMPVSFDRPLVNRA